MRPTFFATHLIAGASIVSSLNKSFTCKPPLALKSLDMTYVANEFSVLHEMYINLENEKTLFWTRTQQSTKA